MDGYGSGLRLEPGLRFNLERGAKAQSRAEVRAQLEKRLRPGLGLAWHVEDFLPVVLVSLRDWPVLPGIQTVLPRVGAGSMTLGRLEGRAERRAAILGLSKSQCGS